MSCRLHVPSSTTGVDRPRDEKREGEQKKQYARYGISIYHKRTGAMNRGKATCACNKKNDAGRAEMKCGLTSFLIHACVRVNFKHCIYRYYSISGYIPSVIARY